MTAITRPESAGCRRDRRADRLAVPQLSFSRCLRTDTLEGFGLAIDPVQRRLIPAILYGA